jgi:hypothetical protein
VLPKILKVLIVADPGEVLMTRKRLTTVILLSVIIITPIVYLVILNMVITKGGVGFRVGWEDSMFQTKYSEPGWFDSNFTQGWSINWTNVNSGFAVEDGFADLYATFNGSNPTHPLGISVIFMQKSIDPIDTSVYPYLVVRHRASSSDSSLALSFALIDSEQTVHLGSYYHTSTSWTNLEVNVGTLYNGTVKGILILFMNGFNPNYSGGLQHAYLQAIGLYKNPPAWTPAYSNQVNANISSYNGILRVSGNGNLKAGTIVSAQRTSNLDFDLDKYRYLNVSIISSGLDVAARIVIWTAPDPSKAYAVLLKTYNDKNWHTEMIDLSYFGINGAGLFMIELSWMQVYDGSSSIVCYSQLSFNSLEVT